MLELLRRYQRSIFLLVTTVTIFSIVFFGAYSTFSDLGESKEEPIVGKTLDGSPLYLSEVQNVIRFLSTDREDLSQSRTQMPNFCNDGVIRSDFIQTGLSDLLVAAYFEPLAEDLQIRLEKAKRFRPYTNAQIPALSAQAVWDRFMPSLSEELQALKRQEKVTLETFTHLSRLYQKQAEFHPELLRRILMVQHQQSTQAQPDSKLVYGDLSLFGFQTLTDWFGPHFIELVAQFVLNAAKAAEEKGYQVSLEEAKGDLLYQFTESMKKLSEAKIPAQMSLQEHLRALGFTEQSAAMTWRKILLFRKYFHDVGETVFVDHLPYQKFQEYTSEVAVVQKYVWPLRLHTFEDLMAFQLYLKAISPPEKNPLALPQAFLSVEEVEKRFPSLVQTTYQARLAKISKEQVGLKASFKQVLDWELEEANWKALRKKFSYLPQVDSRQERLQALEKCDAARRSQIDGFARLALMEEHPEWTQEALQGAPLREVCLTVSNGQVLGSLGSEDPSLALFLEKGADGDVQALQSLAQFDTGKVILRIESVQQKEPKQILTFEKARAILPPLVEAFLTEQYTKLRAKYPQKFQAKEGEWKPFQEVKEEVGRLVWAELLKAIDEKEKNEWKVGQGPANFYATHRFLPVVRQVQADVEEKGSESLWLKEPQIASLAQQFRLHEQKYEIQRTHQEDWMKEQAFLMLPNQWSPVHVAENGEIVFFYLRERKPADLPLLERLSFGKETLSNDAKRFLAERLIETTQKKQAIVIPLQREVE